MLRRCHWSISSSVGCERAKSSKTNICNIARTSSERSTKTSSISRVTKLGIGCTDVAVGEVVDTVLGLLSDRLGHVATLKERSKRKRHVACLVPCSPKAQSITQYDGVRPLAAGQDQCILQPGLPIHHILPANLERHYRPQMYSCKFTLVLGSVTPGRR